MKTIAHAGTTQHICFGCGHVFTTLLYSAIEQPPSNSRCPHCNRRVARCECSGIAYNQKSKDRQSRCAACKAYEEYRSKTTHAGVTPTLGLDVLTGWFKFEKQFRREFSRFAREHFLPESSMRDLIETRFAP